MTSARSSRWMLAASAAICVACSSTVSKGGEYAGPSVSVAPTLGAGCPRTRPPATQTELDACLETLRFDPDTLAGDEQPLAVTDPQGSPCPGDRTRNCRYGPLARIEPVIGAHDYSDPDLAEGRIIARIFLGARETESYGKFGLSPGQVTYWWVQKRGTTGRSVYVTTTGKPSLAPPIEYRLEVYPLDAASRARARRALARWIWDPRDEKTEGSCGSASSCR